MLFLFFIWTGLTIYWSYLPEKSVVGFVTNTQLLLLALLLWDLVDSMALTLAALQAYVLGAHLLIVLTVFQFVKGTTTHYLRFGPPGADLDNSALIMAIGIPAALFLVTSQASGLGASRLLRIANYAYAPFAAFGIVLTGTRGAVLASIPTVVYALATFAGGSGRRRAGIIAVAGLATVAAFLAPPASLARIGSIGSEFESTDGLNGRVDIWKESRTAFLHRPLVGVGNDAHRAAIQIHKVAHNTPLSILTETGLIGFTLFVLVMVEVRRSVRRHRGPLARYWRFEMWVIALGSFSLSIEDRKAAWLFVMLAVGSGALVREPHVAKLRPTQQRATQSAQPAEAGIRGAGETRAMALGRPTSLEEGRMEP
jgi:O-antigen ligase